MKIILKNLKINLLRLIYTNNSRKNKKYPMSLVMWEISKHRIFILIVLVLALLKLYFVSEEYSNKNLSFADDVYREYMSYLSGEVTKEKLEYINTEIEYINSIYDNEKEMALKYKIGEITFEEYKDYLEKYQYAKTRKDVILKIKEQSLYLNEIKQIYNIEGYFIYETGILQIINRKFDILLYIAVILVSGGLYICEYKGNSSLNYFKSIIRSTKNGADKTFRAKLITSILSACCLYIIFNVMDMANA